MTLPMCEVCGIEIRRKSNVGREAHSHRRFCSHACSGQSLVMQQESRFWGHVRKSPDCWEWTGPRGDHGYGTAKWDRRTVLAHRKAYELLVGLIPSGLELDHLCRVRACVNLAHLEPVTHLENVIRGQWGPAVSLRTNYCSRGHLFDEANTRIPPDGRRRCRECGRIRKRAAAVKRAAFAMQRAEQKVEQTRLWEAA